MNTLTWHVKKKVILFQVTADLELNDLDQINEQIIQMFEAGDAPIHVIHQAEDVKTPTNILKVSKKLSFLEHENCGWIIEISKNSAVRFIARVVTQLSKHNIKSVKTLEEAHEVLVKTDQSLTGYIG